MIVSDYSAGRLAMVEEQIAGRGIRDEGVLRAMRSVPRHQFVSPDQCEYAYEDRPLNIGLGQTISQPYMVAYMTCALGLRGDETVLEVGTGSGYQAAILSLLAKHVYTIERHPELVDAARERLARLGYQNVTVIHGDGSVGLRECAPYDAILVAAAAPDVSHSLLDQLADDGVLVCPVGSTEVQTLQIFRRKGAAIESSRLIDCVFVPLVGAAGWSETQAQTWRGRD